MATYIIGDIHGCFDGLQRLLKKISYNPGKDDLLFTGDLVNRGPNSPAVLDFIYKNQDKMQIVLGNHDLHLIALSVNPKSSYFNGLSDVCQHKNFKIWCDWLRKQPLILQRDNICLVHAGIYPNWSISQAIHYAKEVESILASDAYPDLLKNMYGNQPNIWHTDLSGWDRIRFIINSCVRMRYLDENGACDFENTMHPKDKPNNLTPWYESISQDNLQNNKIIFGHWASLKAQPINKNILALDGGFVWGGQLIAWCLTNNTKICIT